MNPICFYHSADLDGVCSGAIVKHFVPDVELVGFDYGQEFPWDKVRPGIDAENDPLWAHLYKPENGYVLEVIGDPPKAAIETFKCEKRTVYMVDVSLPPEDMKRLAEVSNLVWLDHHKSCKELWNEINPLGMFRTNRAACELTWEWVSLHIQGGHEARPLTDLLKECPFREIVPEAVRLLGRYDVWDKGNPEWESKILPFQYGMRSMRGVYNPHDLLWESALDPQADSNGLFFHTMRECGSAILRYQAEVNRRAMETGAHEFVWTMPDPELQPKIIKDAQGNDALLIPSSIKFKFEGGTLVSVPNNVMPSYRVLACNTIVFNSQFFDGFYDPEKHDVMCAYCQLKDGRWKVSLYSTKPEIDCGAICKTFGGGGHKGAAGFICDKLPWEK